MNIVDDRLIARCAFEAVGWNITADPAMIADIAVGNAITSLRVLGVAVGPEIVRTVQNDIDLILADPAKIARARAIASSSELRRPANTNSVVPVRGARHA